MGVLKAVIVVAFIGMIASACLLDKKLWFWLVPPALIAIGYSMPVFARARWQRLRDVPFLKLVLIGTVVSFVTVTLPYLSAYDVQSLKSTKHLLLFAGRVFFILAITIPFDIRDMNYDGKFGLKTLPLTMGVKRCY